MHKFSWAYKISQNMKCNIHLEIYFYDITLYVSIYTKYENEVNQSSIA